MINAADNAMPSITAGYLHQVRKKMILMGVLLADAYAIGKILYPAAFSDIDPERKCDEIYTYLVGQPVYVQIILLILSK
jgi:hypothetical protein